MSVEGWDTCAPVTVNLGVYCPYRSLEAGTPAPLTAVPPSLCSFHSGYNKHSLVSDGLVELKKHMEGEHRREHRRGTQEGAQEGSTGGEHRKAAEEE